MSDAEDQLRLWLERQAEHAPRGRFMLDRVRQESARRTRRRRVTLAVGLAAATVTSALGGVTVIGRSAPVQPPLASTTGVAFVPGGRVDAAFPLGMPAAREYSNPAATLVAGRPTLLLTSIASRQTQVTVTIGAGPPPADAKPVRVGAQSAVMAWNGTQKDSGFTVWWTPPTGGWATITVPPQYPLSVIAKIISGLRPGSIPGAEPFTFATVPRGFSVDNIDSTHVTFCPPGTAPSAASADKILARLDHGPLTGEGEHVTVADRPAVLITTDATTVLQVDEGANQILTVQVPSTIHVTRTDLFRFAAGIHPTGMP